MISNPCSARDEEWVAIAAIVDRFEQARSESVAVDWQSFLPDSGHPLHTQIAAELVRVDMERRWNAGERCRLADYRDITPLLFSDRDRLREVAFEEYRLRRQAGERITPNAYSEEYRLATDDWPIVDAMGGEAFADCPAADACEASYPPPGEVFQGFRIVREIGRGAFARAFLAEQNDLARRPVVLKLSRRRSLEPQHLARLQHTNIVPIYSVHQHDGLIAVCMPYHGEQTLAQALQASGGSPPATDCVEPPSTVARTSDETTVATDAATRKAGGHEPLDGEASAPRYSRSQVDEAVRLVRDAAFGLSHAHARGIVHRDLKPANILLANDGRPMLLDFNLSQDAAVDGLESLTIGGTLPYMAPEHLNAVAVGGEVGPPADIYSLGSILFELLAGRRPFPDRCGQLEQVVDECVRDRSAGVPSIRQLNPAVPPSLAAVVTKCLAPDPSARYQTADQLVEDLTRHLDHEALKYAANPSLRERATKWGRRHPRLFSAASVSLASLLVVAALATLLLTRAGHVRRLEAQQHYADFLDQLPEARLALGLPEADRSLLSLGLRTARPAIGMYLSDETDDWQANPHYADLGSTEQAALREQLAELCYLEARAQRVLAVSSVDSEATGARLARALHVNAVATQLLGHESPALEQQRRQIAALSGQPDEAVPLHGVVATSGPIDDYLAAQQLLADRRFEEAAQRLERLRDAHPTDPAAWLLLGYALGGVGDAVGADVAYSAAAALEPRSYVALSNRGLCRLEQGDPMAAVADFDAVLAAMPDFPTALLNRAIAYEAAGLLPQALADLNTAIATGNAPPRALLLRARVKKGLGDAAGAEADRLAGIALVPIDDTGWLARGWAQLADDAEAALPDFRQALLCSPHSTAALEHIAAVAADRLNRPQDALEALDAWLRLEPQNAHPLIGRAVLQARLGQRESALADMQAALRISREPRVLFQAACVNSLLAGDDLQDLDRGLAMLSAAIDGDRSFLLRATSDPDLQSLRKSEGWQALIAAYRELAIVKTNFKKAAATMPALPMDD